MAPMWGVKAAAILVGHLHCQRCKKPNLYWASCDCDVAKFDRAKYPPRNKSITNYRVGNKKGPPEGGPDVDIPDFNSTNCASHHRPPGTG
jgi:hypothetical protein